ncbi:MAG: hypothetical protein RBT47_07590 [Anaerolineae bacterium]|nr:hypothetical protein [Anaerolineae bacterium]
MTKLEAWCLNWIRKHKGKAAAIRAVKLAEIYGGASERKVRQAVECLIKVHKQPICSSYDPHYAGYYWPVSADEVQATYEQLLKHGVRIIQRARVISKYSTEQVLGQLRMELDGQGEAETRGRGDTETSG